MTWFSKAQGLFFYFHPRLGQDNAELTCLLFGYNCPGENIGLIWDFSTAHKSAEVLEYARSLNIVV